MKKFYIVLFVSLLGASVNAQPYEIKREIKTASGWFGGDNRPGQQRNVAVAQSVTIENSISLESFAFYFTAPFDFIINPTGMGHEVTLKLHIRDSLGQVISSKFVVVPNTFTGGWVTWSGINLNLNGPAKYIFSTYLVGGYDSIQVYSGQSCDVNGTYDGGERFAKYVVNDSDAVAWGDWSQHTWDSDFWLTGTLSSTDVNDEIWQVNHFVLEQNFPNPFNPSTKISWQSPEGNHQTLKVYNILGNELATLVDEYKSAGSHAVEFDAASLPSGLYFYELKAGNYAVVKKMILMK